MSHNGTKCGNDFYECTCAVCGKELCISYPQDWAYKKRKGSQGTRMLYCCSWKCFRQLPETNKVGKRSGKREEIFKLLKEGKSRQEIADELMVSDKTVKYWEERFKP